MTDPAAQVERELQGIAGILAVRSVTDETDVNVVREIRVLAAPGRPSADIAAEVTSVLKRRGLRIGRNAVHVVHISAPADGSQVETDAAASGQATPSGERPAPDHIEIESVVVVTADGSARAIATLRLGDRIATGSTVVVPASVTLRRGVAESTLAALCELLDAPYDLAVENAIIVSAPPHDVALVTLAAVVRSGEETLVGAVAVSSGGVNDGIARAVVRAAADWISGRRDRAE